MGIIIKTEYYVRCDVNKSMRCHWNTSRDKTLLEAKEHAVELGWKETKEEKWICPACQKEKPPK